MNPARAAEDLALPPRTAFPLFLTSLGSWYGAWGVQTVMFQWLIVGELGESAARVGTAQMTLLVPSLFFILIGGALADRVDRRRALITLHTLAACCSAGLAVIVSRGGLSYGLLIGYALIVGTVQALVIPMRDAQLSDVVRSGMSRAVAGLTMVQHGSQGIGSLVAGAASVIGAPAALGVQALIALGGALPTRLLPRIERPPRELRPPIRPGELRAGLLEVVRSPVLRSIMLLNVSVGLTFVGAYVVLLPLLVRDLYGGGAEQMAILVAALPAGTIVVNVLIVLRGGIERPGRSLLLGQGFAGLCLGALAFGLPFWGAALSAFSWGVGAAYAITASRTLFQEHASDANRGRVLSVYSLAILGTGPIGALVAGLVAEWIGPLGTFAAQSVVMTAIISFTLAFTRVRHVR